MKSINLCFVLSIITLVINTTKALNSKLPVKNKILNEIKNNSVNNYSNNNIAENPYESTADKFYMIFVDNKIDENGLNKRQDSNAFVNELIVEISNIIEGNIDTYQDPEKLEEFQQNRASLRKRNEGSSSLAYEISSLNDRTIIYSYLSNDVAELIKDLPNVVAVTPDRLVHWNNVAQPRINEPHVGKPHFSSEQQLSDIKNETGWQKVEVREKADNHLSMLSQGKYNEKLIGEYDQNYYYPSSAGQDIDIFVLDSRFNFRHSEFSNKNERIAKCLFAVENGSIKGFPEEDKCELPEYKYVYHGQVTSDVAAGLVHGVANKANVYGIIPSGDESESGPNVFISNVIVALQYINDNLLRPHHAVFNMSFGYYLKDFKEEDDQVLIKYWGELFREMSNKGAVFVTGAGNDNVELVDEYIAYPCAFDDVICVGATDVGYSEKEEIFDEIDNIDRSKYSKEEYERIVDELERKEDKADKEIQERIDNKTIYSYYYHIALFSNYGENVDIYAPGFVSADYMNENDENESKFDRGTSFSSPIVAGVAATIMSEHPEIKFNTKTMLQYLLDIGQKGIVKGIPGNYSNVFINNGKHTVYSQNDQYYGCGPYSGNQTCSAGLFCSSDGFCLFEEDQQNEEVSDDEDNDNENNDDIESINDENEITEKIETDEDIDISNDSDESSSDSDDE